MSFLKIPSHVAIIMDGNGRWAELRGRDRTFGHLKGARVAKKIIQLCTELGVPQLTLYAFSTENWMRPISEVNFLMKLLARHLRRERQTLLKNNIRFSVIGDISRLPQMVIDEVVKTIYETKDHTGMSLTFALSYGGRQEITGAVRALAKEIENGRLKADEITEEMIAGRLQTAYLDQPDPDLIIRTSGEYRLSNFMLWQAAYSEFFITPTLWPDFTQEELQVAFQQFGARERRFGRAAQSTGHAVDGKAIGQATNPPASSSGIKKISASDLAAIIDFTSARRAGL
jgi:undecaprenyl diphosphate synthase